MGQKGAHINGVGAYTPEMCEIPREIIKAADIVIFDTMDGVLKEVGTSFHRRKMGIFKETAIMGN